LVSSGELSARTWADYFDTCKRIGKVFGLRQLVADLNAPDLERLPAELARIGGAVTLGNEVTRARVVFGYAYQQGLIEHPVKFGAGFKRPTKKTLRLARAAKGPRMFDAEPLRKLLDAAPMPLRAMILLGINCGFGNADCAGLPVKALDLDGAWVNYPRPKTGISRRCPLWPETVAALLEAITNRPAPRDEAHAGLAFLTCRGNPWGSAVLEEPEEPGGKPKVHIDDPLAKEFAKLVRSHKGWRPGLSFYALRHTFETIGGDSRDQVAVDHIMGHGRNDMSSVYRERISDERLKAVTDHVRRWLFGRDVGAEAVDLNKLVAAEQAAESTLPDTPPARRPTKARRSRTKAK
jgi:integrase